MNDAELDALFAQAREETEADRGSAERFLARHRANLAATADHSLPAAGFTPRPAHRTLWPLLLAAALGAGLLARPLWPVGQLPSSAAYDTYQATWGEGW
ncbi:hypothetical protein SAMN04488058_10679 [Deinococcus reticulitermitis]|uniref:Uncharacterized protein n=1 Tax=Deinococcus reticulitermitis TaxID=856736 RepID=A0A1H6Y373_9DEIO|nr:hypothetical protein [Deinococcus reticulitermitis]SEJ33497.1 hypothetical protein SAMN04488058_10679 [Deinococcus reticulitermitis]